MSEEQRGDFATFGGYLCALAGEIPAVSDHIVVPDYIFTIEKVRGEVALVLAEGLRA
jgi:CBS domain containing-hemolysin-like protein